MPAPFPWGGAGGGVRFVDRVIWNHLPPRASSRSSFPDPGEDKAQPWYWARSPTLPPDGFRRIRVLDGMTGLDRIRRCPFFPQALSKADRPLSANSGRPSSVRFLRTPSRIRNSSNPPDPDVRHPAPSCREADLPGVREGSRAAVRRVLANVSLWRETEQGGGELLTHSGPLTPRPLSSASTQEADVAEVAAVLTGPLVGRMQRVQRTLR